jgi:MerR family transcriptional regulator, copper efflux regulator
MNFTVSKLADAAGVGIETIRFYQKRGLLAQPDAKKGYRTYESKDVARVQFIKRAQALGFTLKEIAELIELEEDANSRCGDVQVRASDKIRAIDAKLADLNKMRAQLVGLASSCDRDQALSDCRLMNCLSGAC